MPLPKYIVRLTDEERTQLEDLIRTGTRAASAILHARILLNRIPLPAAPSQPERVDYEYERRGTANLFLTGEPLVGQRHVAVTEQRTAVDFAREVRNLLEVRYPHAEKVVLVMDHLNTHKPAALYEAFEPTLARSLVERLEIHHTPKHGRWLNRAEIELSVLSRQCLDRRIPDAATLTYEVAAWEHVRNADPRPVNWRFTTPDARIKLKRLYPSIQVGSSITPALQSWGRGSISSRSGVKSWCSSGSGPARR
ncbi:MAG: transposase [Candidatus Contendobacter sp.]